MRVKSLSEPTGMNKGDEWLSPDGHSSTWHRTWNGTSWDVALNSEQHPEPTNETELGESEIDPDSLEELEIKVESDEQPPTEDQSDEQGMQAAVPDSDGGEQGAGGKPEPEPKQRGKRGQVRKGRKGK
jgi:hypothetical protein